jgi:hypothetical protein
MRPMTCEANLVRNESTYCSRSTHQSFLVFALNDFIIPCILVFRHRNRSQRNNVITDLGRNNPDTDVGARLVATVDRPALRY